MAALTSDVVVALFKAILVQIRRAGAFRYYAVLRAVGGANSTRPAPEKVGEYGLCELWRNGVSDLGEFRVRFANWREFGVESLDACAFAPE